MTTPGRPELALLPEDAEAYLRGKGWERTSSGQGPAELWQKVTPNGREEVLIPLAAGASDYASRWSDLIQRLAAIESATPDSVFDAVLYAGADVVEWRAVEVDEYDFTLPLDAAQRLISGARDAVIAAASTAIQRRSFYGHRKTKQAREQAKLVRMGQTRRGSYVVPIISRIPVVDAATKLTEADRLLEATVVPFQRQVFANLASGLSAVHQLAVEAGRAPTKKQLYESVRSGVSAELCSAVTTALSTAAVRDLTVSFAWSARLPRPATTTGLLNFPSGVEPILLRMQDDLREADQPARQDVVGTVINLHHDEGDDQPEVTVRMALGTQRRQVKMRLEPRQHEVATECYRTRQPIRATGVLTSPRGGSLLLEDISGFEIAQPYLHGME